MVIMILHILDSGKFPLRSSHTWLRIVENLPIKLYYLFINTVYESLSTFSPIHAYVRFNKKTKKNENKLELASKLPIN